MDKVRIYPILDYILNRADADELAAIREALKRREQQKGFGGLDVQTLARESGREIEEQIGGSIESIRDMIRGFAVEIIKKEAPDIPERDLAALLEAWIPDPASAGEGGRAPRDRESEGGLPRDVLITMIGQYIAFKTGTMRPDELRSLAQEISDWPEVYWERFPERVRRIIGKYLKNEIEADLAWELIERSL